MNPIEQLKSVLCDPSGKCCIKGTDEDRAIVDRALQALEQPEEEPVDCPRIELVVAIHSLASDFENMFYLFGADTEDRKRALGSIAHAMKIAGKHNQNGAGCKTYTPRTSTARAIQTHHGR